MRILIGFCLIACLIAPAAAQSFEKKAIDLVQRTPVSTLEEQMPRRSFIEWFKGTVGEKAGIVWQVSECDQSAGPREPGADLPACVEANALLPDGRKVVVLVAVGTFRKGITGDPGFYYAVIEQQAQLYSLNRLSDLPESLTSPEKLRGKAEFRVVLAEPAANAPLNIAPAPSVKAEPGELALTNSASPVVRREFRRVSEGALLGSAIKKVSPVLSASAKRLNAWGDVQVLLKISEAGQVTEARAISGHLMLRASAVKAAQEWVFNPAKVNGAPVASEGVITFVFERP